MRWLAGFCLLLASCSSCRAKEPPVTKEVDAAPASPAPAPAPAPPPLVVFEDAGDRGTLALGRGLSLVVRPAGPSLIVVDLEEPTPRPPWRSIEIERRPVGREGATQQDGSLTSRGRRGTSLVHSAEPGQTWAYRAKLDGGAWTSEVNVRTADPKTPPPPLTNVVATSTSPWTVDLAWDLDERAVAGIEIDVKDGAGWSLLTIVNPHERKFSHGHRTGKQTSQYRVAAFNRNGKSAFVESAPVTTPEKAKPRPPRPLSPCIEMPKPSDPMVGLSDSQIQEKPALWSWQGAPGSIAPRRLIGEYRGCLRDLGAFELQGDSLTHVRESSQPTEGFPVLVGILGAGLNVGVQLGTFAFENGHYEEVDRAQFCGEPYEVYDAKSTYAPKLTGEILERRGPFEECLEERPAALR